MCLVTEELCFCDIVSGIDVRILHMSGVKFDTLRTEHGWKLWRTVEAEKEDTMLISTRIYMQVLSECSITVNREIDIL